MELFMKRVIWVVLLLAVGLGLAGCNLPAQNPTASPTVPPSPTALPLKALPSPTSKPTVLIELTQTPSLVPTKTPTAVPATQTPSITPTALAKPIYKGLLAYTFALETMTAFDFTGAPLNLKFKTTGSEWILPNTVQYANNSVYYLKYKEKAIYQIAANGAAKKLTFIPAKDSLHFLISLDGKKIAWSFINQTTGNPASELWLANIDGSGAKKIAQIDAASNSKWLTFEPYRWLPDGRLLYVEEPTGIGGYILFSGFAGIRVFDPAANVSNTLTPGVGSGNLCLSEISPDLKVVVSACATNNHSVLSFVTIANKNVVSIAEQADQKQAGSAFYSPGGSWLAYAFAIANPDAEQGKVAVVQANGTTPKILDTVKNGYFNVVGWVSEQQFVVQRYEGDKPSLWLFNRDGSAPIKLADGSFAAFIPK